MGVNLAGDYSTTVGGPYYVTTPAIDCSQYTNVTLDFQRWLNTDWGSYVGATIDVWNGTAWHNIYSNPDSTEVFDATWQHVTYSLAQYADGNSAVKIRWGYQVKRSDSLAMLRLEYRRRVAAGRQIGHDG